MATIYQQLTPEAALLLGSAFPQYKKVNGTNYPVSGLYFDSAADEDAFWIFRAVDYGGSGTVTLDVDWYADTGTASEAVVFQAQLGALTPNTDDTDIETKTLGTQVFVSDSQIAGVDQRLHRASLSFDTAAKRNSMAADDWMVLKFGRDGNGTNATDDLTGDAVVTLLTLSYSDT